MIRTLSQLGQKGKDYYQASIDHLESSLAHHAVGGLLAFRERQTTYGSDCEQMARLAAIRLVQHFPQQSERLIGRRLPPDIRRIGAGYHMIAYRTGDYVIKAYKRSVWMSDEQREELREEEQKKQDFLMNHLGHLTIPSSIVIGRYPADTRRFAVQIRQPFINYRHINNVIPSDSAWINHGNLYRLLDRHPHLEDQFTDLAVNGLRMKLLAKHMPDISGFGNLGITEADETPRLVLIDSIPCQVESDWSKGYIVPQLMELHAALQARSSELAYAADTLMAGVATL